MPFLGKTPTKFLDANVNIDGGTIDGTTIGATSAAAGTFTNLTATGTLTFPDDGISGDDISGGTATLDGLTVDTNTLVVDSTNNRVGINDAAPDRAFVATSSQQVVGRIESTSTAGFLAFSDSGSANEINVRLGSAGDDFKIYTGGAEQVTIASSGNVGIGTTSPDNKFHVVSGSAGEVAQFTGAVEARGLSIRSETNTDASALVVFNSQSGGSKGMFTFETDGSERMRIDASGNVGINYTNPDVPLCVGVDAGNTLAARFGTLSSAKAGDDVFVRLQARDSGSSNKYFDIRHLVDDAALTINGPTSSLPEILRIDADGIKFGGETTAAHALDDYEEGSWLPTPKDNSGNAATFQTRVGYYVKIGRLVYVTVDLVNISTTGCTSTDAVQIQGLPFTPITGAGNTYHTGIAAVGGGVASSENVIGVRISENVDYIVMTEGSQNLMGDLVKFQDMSTGSPDIRFSMSYYTND